MLYLALLVLIFIGLIVVVLYQQRRRVEKLVAPSWEDEPTARFYPEKQVNRDLQTKYANAEPVFTPPPAASFFEASSFSDNNDSSSSADTTDFSGGGEGGGGGASGEW